MKYLKLFLIVLVLAFTASAANAQLSSHYLKAAPTLDGEIGYDEWSASWQTIIPGDLGLRLYLMSDDSTLYFAIDVALDAAVNLSDQVVIYFDNDGDGAWPNLCPGTTEGRITISPEFPNDGPVLAQYNSLYGATPSVCADRASTALTGYVGTTPGHLQYEFSIDLTDFEMAGGPGLTIGFYIEVTDADTADTDTWPTAGDPVDPSTFEELDFESPPEQLPIPWTNDLPQIDGVIAPGEWANAEKITVEDPVEYEVYIMANDVDLYLAFDLINDPLLEDEDYLRVYFDNDNNGGWSDDCETATDGRYKVSYFSTGMTYGYETFISFYAYKCGLIPSTNVVAAAAQTVKGNPQYEMKLDLTAGEIYGAPGQTIGMRFFNPADTSMWPLSSSHLYPSTWAEATFPTCAGCQIDSYCYDDEQVNPENECQVCDIGQSIGGWSDNDGVSCLDDGLFCTGDETCSGGDCISAGDPCDSELYCNEKTDTCDEDPPIDDDDDDDNVDDDDNIDDDDNVDDDDDDDTVDDDDFDGPLGAIKKDDGGGGSSSCCGCV